ncbi:unnamed protein product [Jaminaea pallidilutea]
MSSADSSSSQGPRALSNREEDAMMKQIRLDALKKCDDVVKDFADCAKGRTVSVVWACRKQNRDVQDCLSKHMSEESVSQARKEWLLKNRS